MIRPLLTCILLSAICTGAAAQTPLERSLERCQAIADSLLRLRCYDAIKPPAREPAQSTKPSDAAETTKPAAPAETTKPTEPADNAGFNFQGSFDAAADCTVPVVTPWFKRSFPVNNIPLHGDLTGTLNPDKAGTVDLDMTVARSSTNHIHFGGTLGQQVPAPGGTARAEITSPNHLRLSWDLPNNVIVVEVDVTGQSCTATANFELKPGKSYYTLHDGRRLYGCGKPRITRTACRIR